jgi:hypothetical protein
MQSVITRTLTLTAGALALALTLAAPVAAEMYTYRDPATGKRIISNTPPPEGVQGRELAPDMRPSDPALTPAAPAVALSEATPPVRRAAEDTRRPVDTLALGNITRGMTAATVRERLGEPASIRPEGTVKTVKHSPLNGPPVGTAPVELTRETWVYPGNSQIPTAEVTFEGGVVVSTARAR